MSDLRQAILNKVVIPEMKRKASNTVGTILQYKQSTNLADVKYIHPSSNSETLGQDIKVNIDNGLCTAGPFPGDKVNIIFYENNMSNPIIDKVIDNDFENNTNKKQYTHTKQGSLYPLKPDDNPTGTSYEDIKEKPNIENYNNKSDESKRIYNSGSSPIKQINKKIEMVDKFSEAEVGLIHPFNNSLIHIRDNGIIDLFAETNNGIRIDPIEQSTNEFANLIRKKANNLIAHIYNNATYNVANKFEINSDNEIVINGKNKITLNSDGTLDINVANGITINGDNFKINSRGKMSFNSNGDMIFNAPKYDFK